jgi:flagellin-like protein
MRKLLKSKKALSPVVAAIILIAVTVAVSIAVAAWMGALTFSFMKSDEFNVASVTFIGTSPSYTGINMSIQDTGSSPWTVTSPGQVNSLTNVAVSATGTANTLTCAAGSTIYVKLTTSCSSGNKYSITLLLTDGNKITYIATAP